VSPLSGGFPPHQQQYITKATHAILTFFRSTNPFANLYKDLLGPLKETEARKRFLPMIVDRFSKPERAVPLAGVNATDVSSAFFRDWISVYGPPDTVLRDNGPQFASLFCNGACNLMGIRRPYATT